MKETDEEPEYLGHISGDEWDGPSEDGHLFGDESD